jgi:hypothetical protein
MSSSVRCPLSSWRWIPGGNPAGIGSPEGVVAGCDVVGSVAPCVGLDDPLPAEPPLSGVVEG